MNATAQTTTTAAPAAAAPAAPCYECFDAPAQRAHLCASCYTGAMEELSRAAYGVQN